MHAGKTTARRRGARLVAGLASTALVGSGGLFLADSPPVVATKAKADPAAKASTLETYANLPISFEANHGQTDPQVKLMSRGPDGTLFLTPNEAVLSLPTKADTAAPTAPSVLRMKLLGASPNTQVSGANELPGKVNYLNAEPANSYSNVPTYSRAEYKAVYPGIDMAWYGKGSNLEYDFIVAPGASPSTIQLGFEGAKGLRLDKTGDLVMKVEEREVRQHKPVLYQEVGGERRAVPGRFVLRAGKRVGFSVGAYDRRQPLVIDPVLVWSSYLGGSSADIANELEVDGVGNAYLAGTTRSADFPVRDALQPTKVGTSSQMFVTKIIQGLTDDPDEPAKPTLAYSTYLNGTLFALNSNGGLAVDDAGSVHVSGRVGGEFPTTPGAYQTAPQGNQFDRQFLTKLTPDGSALAYSTYWNPNGGRFQINAVDVDDAGDVYFGGSARFSDFTQAFPGTNGAYQPTCVQDNFGEPLASCGDAFVAKLHPTAEENDNDLSYFTYLGGQQGEHVSDLDVNADGLAYLTGGTGSTAGNLGTDPTTWFPTTSGAYDRDGAGGFNSDVWVAQLNPAGGGTADLVYSTLIGGSDAGDDGVSVAPGPGGTIYAAGGTRYNETSGPGFPTTSGAFQTTKVPGELGFDAYLAKFDPAGNGVSDLVYSTLIGGARFDAAFGLVVDGAGLAYLTGDTISDTFPTKNPIQKRCSCFYDAVVSDVFVAVVRPDPNDPNNGAGDPADLVFSTFLGGTGQDIGNDIALDAAGNIYVAGLTNGPGRPPTGIKPKGFPIKEAFQRKFGGDRDAFIFKITSL